MRSQNLSALHLETIKHPERHFISYRPVGLHSLPTGLLPGLLSVWKGCLVSMNGSGPHLLMVSGSRFLPLQPDDHRQVRAPFDPGPGCAGPVFITQEPVAATLWVKLFDSKYGLCVLFVQVSLITREKLSFQSE